jgi:hypothetical protein
MLIAFNVFDVDGDQNLTRKELSCILRNIPLIKSRARFGVSSDGDEAQFAGLNRVEFARVTSMDHEQIESFLDLVFKDKENNSLYFDEFVTICQTEASDLFVCVFDSLQKCIPCVQQGLVLLSNYSAFMQTIKSKQKGGFHVLAGCKLQKVVFSLSNQRAFINSNKLNQNFLRNKKASQQITTEQTHRKKSSYDLG